jgi:predicted aspartyl protease
MLPLQSKLSPRVPMGNGPMGRIYVPVSVENPSQPGKQIHFEALVDTGAAHLVLPSAWKSRLGEFDSVTLEEFETANQQTIRGEICGPAIIQVDGFRRIYNEVVFIDTDPIDGTYEPLLGYIILEQCPAAVDMKNHRLVAAKHFDLK